MRFYDRERELAVLQNSVKNAESAMIVVSGRRRVGKSRLVAEFLKKNNGLKILVVPKEEKQVASDFAEMYYPSVYLGKESGLIWTGTLIAYEAPGEAFGKRIAANGYILEIPREFQGKKNIALVCNHPNFDIKGNNIVVKKDSVHGIRFPTKEGWYKQDEFGIPTGAPSHESDHDARYLRRRMSRYIGLAARSFLERRVVDTTREASERLGVIMVPHGQKPRFDNVREAFEYFFTASKERILYVDEFPNLIEVNPAIPYELQRLWEIYREKTDKILIFSGSYVSMMDRIFTRQKAPLFNRATFKIILEPLAPGVIWSMQEDIGVHGAEKKITNYCIFGGIPYYYEVLEKYGAPTQVERMFFDVGQFRDEGQDILRQEFGSAYKKYFSILEAIGSGLVSTGEIANKMGIGQTTLSKYIQALQNDFKLIERRVPFGQNPLRSKKGTYAIKDNILAFWFSHVYGKFQAPPEDQLNMFVSRRFEMLCSEFLADWLAKKGEIIIRTGRWWGQVEVGPGRFEQREIDVAIETDKTVYFGECKWCDRKIGGSELRRLQETAKALATKKATKWVLFSKRGFSITEKADLLLFDSERIVRGK